MYGGREHEDDYDYSCDSCGRGYYADVGFRVSCPHCGGPTSKPSPPPRPDPDDDVWLDPEFIEFDEMKAFRVLKRLGMLHLCKR